MSQVIEIPAVFLQLSPAVSLWVPGVPIPQGSKRAIGVRGGRHLMIEDNPKTRPWRALVSDCASLYRAQHPDAQLPLDGPLAVRFVFRFIRPPSVSAKKRPYPSTKPDLSKLIRAVEDSLTGILIVDDARIVSIMAAKEFGEPGVLIEIWRMET